VFPQRQPPTASNPRQTDHPPVPGEPNGAKPAQVIKATVPARGADAPPTEVTTTSAGLLQAIEGLTRCLERVLEAMAPGTSQEALDAAADELRKAKVALGLSPTQGELSKKGRDAHAAQRADPSHSPHFGG
jgi:hypothetical protein